MTSCFINFIPQNYMLQGDYERLRVKSLTTAELKCNNFFIDLVLP